MDVVNTSTSPHKDRLNGDLKFNGGSLADLESQFLQERICQLEAHLAQKMDGKDGFYLESGGLDWCRYFQLEPLRAEAEMLEALLYDPVREDTHLEEMLAYRLQRLDWRIGLLSYTHGYDESYWQTEIKRHVVTKVLKDWWAWLQS